MGTPQRSIADIVILNHDAEGGDLAVLDAVGKEECVGRKLAAARAAKGLSLKDVHEGTKVKIAHLEAIENGDQSALPAVPFAAGFVKSFAQFLGLDARAYSLAYKAEFGGDPASAPAIINAPTPVKPQPTVTEIETSAPSAATPTICALPAVLEIAEIDEPAPTPVIEARFTPAQPSPNPGADRFVLYFSVAAAALLAGWIGANLANSKAPVATTVVAEPAAVERAPIAEAAPAAPATIEAPKVEFTIEETPAVAAIEPPKVKPRRAPARDADRSDRAIDVGAAPIAVAEPPAALTTSEIDPFDLRAPADHEAPASAGESIVAAKVTKPVAPKYPERCGTRAKAVETVAVTIDITVEGRPTNAGVAESSNNCFNDAAIDAANRMRFSPRLIDGTPHMEFGKRVTVRFNR
jgi:TonB family protein